MIHYLVLFKRRFILPFCSAQTPEVLLCALIHPGLLESIASSVSPNKSNQSSLAPRLFRWHFLKGVPFYLSHWSTLTTSCSWRHLSQALKVPLVTILWDFYWLSIFILHFESSALSLIRFMKRKKSEHRGHQNASQTYRYSLWSIAIVWSAWL